MECVLPQVFTKQKIFAFRGRPAFIYRTVLTVSTNYSIIPLSQEALWETSGIFDKTTHSRLGKLVCMMWSRLKLFIENESIWSHCGVNEDGPTHYQTLEVRRQLRDVMHTTLLNRRIPVFQQHLFMGTKSLNQFGDAYMRAGKFSSTTVESNTFSAGSFNGTTVTKEAYSTLSSFNSGRYYYLLPKKHENDFVAEMSNYNPIDAIWSSSANYITVFFSWRMNPHQFQFSKHAAFSSATQDEVWN